MAHRPAAEDVRDEETSIEPLLGEARAIVDAQVEVGNDLDTRAHQIFKFDTLAVGVLFSATSILVGSGRLSDGLSDWTVYGMVAGVALLVVSATIAILAYMVTELAVGPRAEDLLEARQADLDGAELARELLAAYARAAETNRERIDATASRLEAALALLFVGLVVLAVAGVGLVHEVGVA